MKTIGTLINDQEYLKAYHLIKENDMKEESVNLGYCCYELGYYSEGIKVLEAYLLTNKKEALAYNY